LQYKCIHPDHPLNQAIGRRAGEATANPFLAEQQCLFLYQKIAMP
jgi:hypothetical protein